MLIACPSCATSYAVDVASLRPNGRQVRCVRCHTVWRPELNQAAMLLAAAGDIAPEAPLPLADPLAPVPSAPDVDDIAWQEAIAEGPRAPQGSFEIPASEPTDVAPGTDAEATGDPVEVDAPPLAPGYSGKGDETIDVAAEEKAAATEAPVADIETYASWRRWRRPSRESLRWPLSHLQNGILALVIIDAVLIGWRTDVVRILPQTVSFYAMMGLSVNVRGLAFKGIATTIEQHEGVPILVVEGDVVNRINRIVDVPRLRFSLRNSAHDEIYVWTAVPPRASLPPRESVSFRTRLASPPLEGRDVLVRFLTRRDIIAGTR